jgi:dethiobiotin synthetase
MKAESIYVAATNQHVGKTTSTLGLVSVLQQKGINIGYCKPVGQKLLEMGTLRVDKDTLLFADLLGFEIKPEIHSPVILGQGATSAYIENPADFDYKERVVRASRELIKQHDLVIYEGTGHPGVGSVVDLSNAQVAKMLHASVIMIVEGGIGSTIDRLNVSLALFREMKVPILGIIVNKVIPDKIEQVRYYIEKKLHAMGHQLLGVLPYEETLAYPIMRTVVDAIQGSVTQNIDRLEQQVEGIMAGSLIDTNRIKKAKNQLLVVGADRVNNAIHKVDLLSQVNGIEESPLAGIVATGEGNISDQSIRYIKKHRIPLVRTHLDTFGSVIKISRIEVKINLHTPWKINRAIELIRENVSLDMLMRSTLTV